MNVMAVVQGLILRMFRDWVFAATVDSISGGTVKVIRDGQSQPEGVFYAAANGLAAGLSGGHRVLVVDVTGSGGYVVVCRIVNS